MEGADKRDHQMYPDPVPERRKGLWRFLETDLDRKDRPTKIFQFIFPWILFAAVATSMILFITIVYGWDIGNDLLNVWIFYTLPPAGKETLIPKAVSNGVPGLAAGISTSAIDICVSLFLIWNYDWVKKLPFVGPSLEKAEIRGKKKLENTRWFRRATFILTTFVVFIPFSGSGGVGGTVFGRIVGLNPYMVLLAVALGSTIGSTGYAMLSETMTDYLGSDNVFISFLSNLNFIQLVVILIAAGVLVYTIRNPKMAAIKTSKVVSDALDFTEKTLDRAEERRKWVAEMTVKQTRKSLRLIGDGSRMVSNFGLEVATKPIELMGKDGKQLKKRSKDFSMRQLDRAHRVAGRTIDRTMDLSVKATSETFNFAKDLTKDGLKETRSGWNGVCRVLVKGGEEIEKRYPKRKKGSDIDEKSR